MRLTYRTMRVLSAIREHPGSSNRAVADEAGISDQAQISKLLARLQGFGLIVNVGGRSGSGLPYAWMLTATGRALVRRVHDEEQGAERAPRCGR